MDSRGEEKAPAIDVGLFFACGVGCSLCQTAILSCLVYWSDLFGPNSFLFLNLCVFSPLFVISVLQAFCDLYFDAMVGTLKAFTFRGCVGFLAGMICLSCVVVADSLVVLCVLSTIIGTASATLFGALNQMAAFLSHCGRLKMGFSFGYQGAGVVVLIMSLSTGFGSSASSEGKYYFFFGCVIIEAICFSLFLLLLFRRPRIRSSMSQRDVLNGMKEGESDREEEGNNWEKNEKRGRRNKSYDGWGGLGREGIKKGIEKTGEEGEENKYLLMGKGGGGGMKRGEGGEGFEVNYGGREGGEKEGGGDVLGYWELWGRGKWCCLCIIGTVASSICLGSWFTQVKTTSVILPQILFFTRIFSDTLGRPPTILFPLSSIKAMGILCVVRLCVVPFFFLSASVDSFPSSGWLLILLVAVLSFSSGFLVTSSYQLAPSQLERGEESSLSKLASLLNVCFSIGCVSGVLLSFALLAFL